MAKNTYIVPKVKRKNHNKDKKLMLHSGFNSLNKTKPIWLSLFAAFYDYFNNSKVQKFRQWLTI